MLAAQAAIPTDAQSSSPDQNKIVRLHITPFRPELLKVYLAPSVQPLAQNISYHTVETFPEKGFGYVELPETEAQKIKKKLNGTTLRGSKVRIEMAKSEKRKAREEADAAKEAAEAERPVKRAKKEKKRKEENGVLEGVELPDDRKVKRGWTEPPSKNKKEKKDKKEKSGKDGKHEQRKSKYTKEPELLFKAKLTPVAAAEVARKEKKEKKREKKEKNKSKVREVVVHEFEKNHKTPTFLKEAKVSTEKKPAVDYVNGLGWVDEDGVVVEPETGRAKARRALELVDEPSATAKAWIDGSAKPVSSTPPKKEKAKKATPPPESSESEADDSSVVSSSSEDECESESESESESEADSDSEEGESEPESAPTSPVQPITTTKPPTKLPTTPSKTSPSQESQQTKEIHPLEALFKRAKPTSDTTPTATTSTPIKKLTPINTSFSFFDTAPTPTDSMDIDNTTTTTEVEYAAPTTPHTQRDIEWRGLRSAAPTPDTAAIGRRFSFDWRKDSVEGDDDDDDEEDDDDDGEAHEQLNLNTKANASATKARLAEVAEEEEEEEEGEGEDCEDAIAGAEGKEGKQESEFRKWFWENRGELNRAWKKRRRDALKAKRHSENKKMGGGGRRV
ncbi:hypothetical protein NX059_006242 [Plenodomus lindquistii]|nr:hypothetical protein NX059_006242 [Plenodomus lindquistii]